MAQQKNKGRPENLKPWKKGQSGNPKGRPRTDKMLSEEMERQLGRPCDLQDAVGRKLFPNKTFMEAFVAANIRLAMKGNATALKEIWERIEGKVPQALTGPKGAPLFPANPFEGLTEEEIRAEIAKRGYEKKS